MDILRPVLTTEHELFPEFARRLLQITECECTLDNSKDILWSMCGVDYQDSVAWLIANGGHCDCEVILNIIAPTMDDDPRSREEVDKVA